MANSIIEINGKKYMSTKMAAKLWGLKPRTVAEYCRNNKIYDKFKNGSLGWYISTDEIKPLSKTEIRRLLTITLQLKNNPEYQIDWSILNFNDCVIERVYTNLMRQGYIEPFVVTNAQKLPYDVTLSEQGFEFVTYNEKEKFDFAIIAQQWLPIIFDAVRLYFEVKTEPM